MHKRLKKIFGLFAMAALAATGLTCCGGGGGDEYQLAYKKYQFDPYDGFSGVMNIAIFEQTGMVQGEYNVKVSFGQTNPIYGYEGILRVVDNTNPLEPTYEISIEGDEGFYEDRQAWAFFSYFTENETSAETMVNFPKPTLRIKFADEDMRGGTYGLTYKIVGEVEAPGGDNPTTEEIETTFIGTFTTSIHFDGIPFRQLP